MKNLLIVVPILLIAWSSSVVSIRRNGKKMGRVENLVIERPMKPSKGLLEKPTFIQNGTPEPDSDEEETTQPSWIHRIWERTFGRGNHDPFNGDDSSQESEEFGEFDGFFASMKPWWKGPNVCNTETQEIVPNNEPDLGSSLFTFLMTNCHDSERSYKCTKRARYNRTAIRIHMLTYECCFGYSRDSRSRLGCPKKLDLQDTTTTLRNVNATKLAGALEDANLTRLISEKMTLFAPSDTAMTSDGQNDINVVILETADKMQFARDILRSHMITGPHVYSSADFEDEQLLPTASNGASIRINIFHRPAPFATANCARIISSDHQTINGSYVHLIDRVLTPVKRNLWQMIEDDPRFSILRSIIDETIKRRLIDSKQHLTLLAFTDDTFEQLPPETRQRIRNKDNCFNHLLLHHILPHTICAVAISDSRSYVRNLANRLMNATRLEDGKIRIGNRKIVTADQMATNGVMHVIDGVILVPEMLDIIGAMKQIPGAAKQLAAALKSTELAPSLIESEHPVTVFVPPSDQIPTMSQTDLRNHIIRQSILDRRVSVNRPISVRTDAGRNISIRFDYDYAGMFDWDAENRFRLYVGCARAERIVSSCNGAIVFLDKPLSTPTQNIYDFLKSKPELSDFVSMIDQAGLADTFKGRQLGGTVLAPTNQALASAFFAADKRRLLSNQRRLRRVLKEHVILGTKCCSDLSGNEWFLPGRYTTMAGTNIRSIGTSAMSTLKIGGADISQCDLAATNGIVHMIDGMVNTRRGGHWERFEEEFFDD